MANRALIFIAEHDESGEVIKGTSAELADIIGVTKGTIQKVALEGRKVGQHWNIRKADGQGEKKPEWKMKRALLFEWEAVTAQIKGIN